MQVSSSGLGGSVVLSNYLGQYNSQINKSLEKLASGLRVRNPADSPGDYFKAQALDRRANETARLERDLETHIGRVQSADGYLATVQSLLDDMSELASEAKDESNATLRASLGKEFDEKYSALETFINTAEYEGVKILTGSYDSNSGGTALSVQIDEGLSDTYSYDILDTRIDNANGLNLSSVANAETRWQALASNASDDYDDLVNDDSGLTRLERNSNRLATHLGIMEGAQRSLASKGENYLAASSALVGVDDAEEATRLSSLQIRQQAAASFLAQNNLVRQGVFGTLAGFSR